MRPGKLVWPWLAVAAVSLVFIGVLVHVARWVDMIGAEQAVPPEPGAEAVARIAAESRGEAELSEVRAAPRVHQDGGLRDRVRSRSLSREGREARPPQGYAFAEHFGEMAKGPIQSPVPQVGDRAHSPDWLDVPSGFSALVDQAVSQNRPWSFGWIRPARDTTPAELARSLAGTGTEIVGRSGRLVRARLPGELSQLRAVASLVTVDTIAAMPTEAKLAGFEDAPHGSLDRPTPLYVTLMQDDPDGRWKRAMESLGAVVGGYDSALRAYRATGDARVIDALAAADFVLAVEPVPIVEATHDTAVPAMGADALRTYTGSPDAYTGFGGASVPVAVMDTGLNVNHLDIMSDRDSVCAANFVYSSWGGPDNPILENDDLWIDARGHGTHVTATIAGRGHVERRFAGMAPAVRHIRFAKVLSRRGSGAGHDVERGMDFLATESGCIQGGRMSARVKPQIVNMSLAWTNLIHEGRDFGARKLDATVWSHRQLYVVANSNANRAGFSNYAAAKNSLAVGAAMDSGELASFSSHGPTADGRLAPNVVATGVRVHSAVGDGSRGGYVALNGTSMASPAAAGVAALLLDAVPTYKDRPALARARLMASAIRPDAWLAQGSGFALNNSAGPGSLQARYGLGKVSARTTVLRRNRPDGWTTGSLTTHLSGEEYAYRDIEVPPGASRLDVVMTWDEPPADAVASTVVNDLDLWLDRDGDCVEEACGEFVSRSRVDNVEWIILRDPEPGTYRVKVIANRIYTAAPRAAVAWTVIRGASTPTLAVKADKEQLVGEGRHELTLTLTADSYVAAGTRLHIDCRSASVSCNDNVTIESVAMSRADTVRVGLEDESHAPNPSGYTFASSDEKPVELGASIPIGEVGVGEERTVHLVVTLGAEAYGARLHFTANAWNGHPGRGSVGIGALDEPVPVPPENDAFSAATKLEGKEGTRSLDLLQATPEPGEPVFESRWGRPAGSVWYTWTAPEGGPFRFEVPGIVADPNDRGPDERRNDRVDVFQGDDVTALRDVASGLWGASFFAENGERYRIRVSSIARGAAMDLRWSPEGRPANDDFSDAIVLEGESGSFEGSGAGATLEPGESFGTLAATTWFRWTAPQDGLWEFKGGQRLLVFEGDQITALRLVGPYPNERVQFYAGGGTEYRIAVAEEGGDESGADYNLSWTGIDRELYGNDWFAEAESIGDNGSSSANVTINSRATVEPGEPPASGVRTQWWVWEAPADGTYTWRLEDAGESSPRYPMMRVSVFAGSAFDALELVAESGPGAPFDFQIDATGGERYSIAVGYASDDIAAIEQSYASATFRWGMTPDNDTLTGAAALTGVSGSIMRSNAFATTGRGERSATLGRSTLWWSYEAPESGWVRFSAEGDGGPWALTVHRDSADGLGLEVIASSRWQRSDGNAVEVLVELEAGVTYTLALGTRAAGRGGEFTLGWEETEVPAWLRYVGRLADGDRDSRGEAVVIRGAGDIALNGSGNALYLGSRIGLHVFERDRVTGRLDQVQVLETDINLAGALLIWDRNRDRLLANDCGDWHVFEPVDGELRMTDEGELPASEDPGTCAENLLLDEAGLNVYRVGDQRLETFAFGPEGDVGFVEEHTLRRGIPSSAMTNDGRNVYIATGGYLWVYNRDPQSGTLTRNEFEYDFGSWYSDRSSPLAVSDDDAYLFMSRGGSNRVHVFSLENPSSPEHLADLSNFWGANWKRCGFADVRSDSETVDVLCPGLAITVRWNPQAGELVGTDFITPRTADRFNGASMPEFGGLKGTAATADDANVYVSTPAHGILTFARVHSVGDPE